MDNNLKILCGSLIVESNKSKDNKIKLLNFVKEADDLQLKTLLLDSKILEKDKIIKDDINKRFEKSEYNRKKN